MATTNAVPQPLKQRMFDVFANSLAPGVNVPDGTFAVNDAGNVKPFTAALAQGGAKFLGVASDSFVNPDQVNPLSQRMLFFRGGVFFVPNAANNDAPTAADVGGEIALSDNDTLKRTIANGDVRVILTEILPSGYMVSIP